MSLAVEYMPPEPAAAVVSVHGPSFLRPDEKPSALAGSGAQCRIPQPKGFRDSVGKELRIGFAGSG